MKNLLYILGLIAIILAIACKKNGTDTPKEAAIIFVEAMSRGDYDAAKKVSTEETKKAIDQIKQLMSAAQNQKKQQSYEFKSEVIEGDRATVKLVNKNDNRESEIYLKKINEKWFVSMDKQQIINKGRDNKQENENIEELGSKDDSKAKYKIGTKVAAVWINESNKYYPGEILSIAGDKEYYIKWRDGAKPSKVAEDKIVVMSKDTKLKPGDQVQAILGNSFWEAKVKKVMPSEGKAVITWKANNKDTTLSIEDIFKKP